MRKRLTHFTSLIVAITLGLHGADGWSMVTEEDRKLIEAAGCDEIMHVYAVYVDERDKVWFSEWGHNLMVRFDPVSEKFAPFELGRSGTAIRQILGRPGEVWLPERGTEHVTVIRTA